MDEETKELIKDLKHKIALHERIIGYYHDISTDINIWSGLLTRAVERIEADSKKISVLEKSIKERNAAITRLKRELDKKEGQE